MQLLIDTEAAPRAELLAIITMLQTVLEVREHVGADSPQLAAPEAPAAVTNILSLPAPTLAAPPAPPADPSVFAANRDGRDNVHRGHSDATPPPPPPPATVADGPAAVATTTAAVSVAASADGVDSTGVRWDERIHASTKAKTKDGAWRTRRNLAPGVFDSVTAELRAAHGVPVIPPPPATVPLPPPPPVVANAIPPPPPVTLPPAPPTAGTAPVLPGANAQPLKFSDVMQRITGAMSAGKLQRAQVDEMLLQLGVAGLLGLNQQPEKLPAVMEHLTRLGV